jgi:hypothetical protein
MFKAALASLGAIFLLACTGVRPVGTDTDPQIAAEIAKIRAIDNHAHPVRPTAQGESPDTEYDALPVEGLEPSSTPMRARPDLGEFAEATRRLYGGDKQKVVRERGEGYAAWVLDQCGIESMFANRVGMGKGLPGDRFRWVPFVDPLLFPLGGTPSNPDNKFFFANEEKLLARYMQDSNSPQRAASLDDYLAKIVRPTLEHMKQGGAVAVKYELAYLRPLDIGNPTKVDADRAYQSRGDYKALQDYIFRFIASECARLSLPIQIHTGSGGGGFFNLGGSNPMLMEPLLNDPAMRKTKFVMLHSGWPFTREMGALLAKPNVYVDFSMLWLSGFDRNEASILREWLEYVPEQVLFGTDAYPFAPEMGWEEIAWVATKSARAALGIALTGMFRDGNISREKAVEIARLVLRENTRKLHGLQ